MRYSPFQRYYKQKLNHAAIVVVGIGEYVVCVMVYCVLCILALKHHVWDKISTTNEVSAIQVMAHYVF